jgi:L-rhamnose isomerase
MIDRSKLTPSQVLDRVLVLEMVRVTEYAAIAANKLVGRGDEKAADAAAVAAMRDALMQLVPDAASEFSLTCEMSFLFRMLATAAQGTVCQAANLLRALLLPQARLKSVEEQLDFTARLLWTEELKDLPFAAVWAEFCARQDVPTGASLISSLHGYQHSVASRG